MSLELCTAVRDLNATVINSTRRGNYGSDFSSEGREE
jgi:hypothetical protein